MDYIFYVHKGNQRYLSQSIQHTKKMNPLAKIVLLGDEANKDIVNASHEYISEYYALGQEIEKCYRHNSPNSEDFELFCITRWFVIYEYMKKHGIKVACHLDSDAILDTKLDIDLMNGKFCYCHDGGHLAMFTIESLEAFCRLIRGYYTDDDKKELLKDIFKFRSENDLFGGVHDLTFFCFNAIFNTDNSKDLSVIRNQEYFDHNINESEGFETICGKKKIYAISGHYYVREVMTLSFVRIKLLHLQGKAKAHFDGVLMLPTTDEIKYFDYYSSVWKDIDDIQPMSNKQTLKLKIKEIKYQVKKKIEQVIAMSK